MYPEQRLAQPKARVLKYLGEPDNKEIAIKPQLVIKGSFKTQFLD